MGLNEGWEMGKEALIIKGKDWLLSEEEKHLPVYPSPIKTSTQWHPKKAFSKDTKKRSLFMKTPQFIFQWCAGVGLARRC